MRMKREQNQSQVWFSEVGDKCHLLTCFSSMFVCGSVRVRACAYVRAFVCERVCVCLSVCHLVLQSPLQCTASAAASSSLHLPFTSIRPLKTPVPPPTCRLHHHHHLPPVSCEPALRLNGVLRAPLFRLDWPRVSGVRLRRCRLIMAERTRV